MGDKKIDPNERVEAVWVIDSETGRKLLIDTLTNNVLVVIDEHGEPK